MLFIFEHYWSWDFKTDFYVFFPDYVKRIDYMERESILCLAQGAPYKVYVKRGRNI